MAKLMVIVKILDEDGETPMSQFTVQAEQSDHLVDRGDLMMHIEEAIASQFECFNMEDSDG